MYTINDNINGVEYKGLQAAKLLDLYAKEILHISLAEDSDFPEHISPRDAHLLVIEGAISFFINNTEYKLIKHQVFNFPKDVPHAVKAIKNSKFLIIR